MVPPQIAPEGRRSASLTRKTPPLTAAGLGGGSVHIPQRRPSQRAVSSAAALSVCIQQPVFPSQPFSYASSIAAAGGFVKGPPPCGGRRILLK